MPTTVVGLVLFVLLLVPGLAHVLLAEREGSARRLSPFRETASVAFVSVLALAATGGVFAIVRCALPAHTPDVGELVRRPHPYFVDHYAQLCAWASGMLVFATLLALAAGSRAASAAVGKLRRSKVLDAILPPARGNFASAWTQMFLHDKPSATRTYVGAVLNDGTYVAGYLRTWNRDSEDSPDRELTLTDVSLRPVGGAAAPLENIGMVSLSARNLQWLSATYVPIDHGAPASDSAAKSSGARRRPASK